MKVLCMVQIFIQIIQHVRQAFNQTTLSEMNFYLNGATHGPTHVSVGGAWVNDNSLEHYSDLISTKKFSPSRYCGGMDILAVLPVACWEALVHVQCQTNISKSMAQKQY